MDTSEDDPVIQELDVFLTTSLKDSLYLVQYPLTPRSKAVSETPLLAAKFSTEAQRLEVQLKLDTSKHYDADTALNIATHANLNAVTDIDPETGAVPPKPFPSGSMDHYWLKSATVPLGTNYALAVLREGALHLNPLVGAMQMKPNFGYLDLADRKATAVENDEDDEDDDGDKELKPITVLFKRKETGKSAAKKKSFDFRLKLEGDADLAPLSVLDAQDARSAEISSGLYCSSQAGGQDIGAYLTPGQYLKALVTSPSDDHTAQASLPPSKMSLHDVRQLKPADQIEKLLLKVQVLTYDDICYHLHLHDRSQVTNALEKKALFLDGYWVVRSELLYPVASRSPVTNIDVKHVARCRNTILAEFKAGRPVRREEIAVRTQVPVEDVTDVLNVIAVQERLESQSDGPVTRVWRFRYKSSPSFATRFPDIVLRQESQWQQLLAALQAETTALDAATQAHVKSRPPAKAAVEKKTARVSKVGIAAAPKEADMTPEQRKAAAKPNARERRQSSKAIKQESVDKHLSAEAIIDETVFRVTKKYGVCNLELLMATVNTKRSESPQLQEIEINEATILAAATRSRLYELPFPTKVESRLRRFTTELSEWNDSKKFRKSFLLHMPKAVQLTRAQIVAFLRSEMKREVPAEIFAKIVKKHAVLSPDGLYQLKEGLGDPEWQQADKDKGRYADME